jgi:hypothetical protein
MLLMRSSMLALLPKILVCFLRRQLRCLKYVWDLQQAKLKMSQQRLSELWTSNSLFAGECYQLDVASGLKIQSLPIIERMQILMKVTEFGV